MKLFIKICDAMHAAHLRGITHRDLSPSNMLIDERGEPHVLDFGLARTAFDRFVNPTGQDISITGQFLGKLAYASPEQAKGDPDKIDIRTDVYALGVILYQIVTGGRFPYEVIGNIVDVLNNIIHVRPVPPSRLADENEVGQVEGDMQIKAQRLPAASSEVEAIILKALEKQPDDWYQSAGELSRDVANYLSGRPIIAQPHSPQSPGASAQFRNDKQWEGLSQEELRQVELLFCPPMFREKLLHTPEKHPLARAGFMLGLLLDQTAFMNSRRRIESRRIIPRTKDLADILEEKSPLLSRLMKGRPGKQKRDRELWNQCRRAFRVLTLRRGNDKFCGDPQSERERIAQRMDLYLFGPESSVVGQYFVPDLVGVPQTSDEGAYHLLWLGMESLLGKSSPHLTVASGGPVFPYSRNSALTPLGASAFYAVMCGVKIDFVYPKLSASTSASESAQEFIRLLRQKCDSATRYPTLVSMAALCSKAVPVCSEEVIDRNVTAIVIPLTGEHWGTDVALTWPGQFLTAGVRFVRIPFGYKDRVFAVRSVDQGPFAFELDDLEREAFGLWERTFVRNRNGQRG